MVRMYRVSIPATPKAPDAPHNLISVTRLAVIPMITANVMPKNVPISTVIRSSILRLTLSHHPTISISRHIIMYTPVSILIPLIIRSSKIYFPSTFPSITTSPLTDSVVISEQFFRISSRPIFDGWMRGGLSHHVVLGVYPRR